MTFLWNGTVVFIGSIVNSSRALLQILIKFQQGIAVESGMIPGVTRVGIIYRYMPKAMPYKEIEVYWRTVELLSTAA